MGRKFQRLVEMPVDILVEICDASLSSTYTFWSQRFVVLFILSGCECQRVAHAHKGRTFLQCVLTALPGLAVTALPTVGVVESASISELESFSARPADGVQQAINTYW